MLCVVFKKKKKKKPAHLREVNNVFCNRETILRKCTVQMSNIKTSSFAYMKALLQEVHISPIMSKDYSKCIMFS